MKQPKFEVLLYAKKYRIVNFKGQLGIQCKKCGMISYHPTDVEKAYCGNCGKFLEKSMSWNGVSRSVCSPED